MDHIFKQHPLLERRKFPPLVVGIERIQRRNYGLLQDGKIQNVRMGRLYRVPKVAVIDYLCSEEKT